jgi:glycosyltransferase involved in cell wall biosynthesis
MSGARDETIPGRVDVLHMVDSLEIGGAERMAVNLVNSLPRDRFTVHLCTTRGEGPLAVEVKPDIRRLRLNRKWRFDPLALLRLIRYLRSNHILIIHAHSSTLFLARLAAATVPKARVLWHDHYGRSMPSARSTLLYLLATQRIAGVISVNAKLAEWARTRLRLPAAIVWQLNNFAVRTQRPKPLSTLPGHEGLRVVCVANFKPEKGHRDLLRAIAIVRQRVPHVRLLLVGTTSDAKYRLVLENDLRRLDLTDSVSFLEQRRDVEQILAQCSVGVLSSHHEGLPLALLEYGLARLAVVATDVGECAAVLGGGAFGIIVHARQPLALASAIERLLTENKLRLALSDRFHRQVSDNYSEREALSRLCAIYQAVSVPQNTVAEAALSSLINA